MSNEEDGPRFLGNPPPGGGALVAVGLVADASWLAEPDGADDLQVSLSPWRDSKGTVRNAQLLLRASCTRKQREEWSRAFMRGNSVEVEYLLKDAYYAHWGELLSVRDSGPIADHGLVPVESAADVLLGRLEWREGAYYGRTRFRGRMIEVVVEGDSSTIPDASALHRTIGERFDEYVDYLAEAALDVANEWRELDDSLSLEEFRSRLWFEAIVYGEPGARITCGEVDPRDDQAFVLLLDPAGNVVDWSQM